MIGKIVKVAGPLVQADNMQDCRLFDMVKIGKLMLTGEIIEMRNGIASIQVYEDTSMLSVGEEVVSTGKPLSVELAPGIIGRIFDGIQRPLDELREKFGNRIIRGMQTNILDREKYWHFYPTCKVGDRVRTGDELGYVDETIAIKHKILVPQGVAGVIEKIDEGDFRIEDTIATIVDGSKVYNAKMLQTCPIRKSRPYTKKLPLNEPMTTGQRVIDFLFPIARGGVAGVPGPFGSGKTIVQHQLAKWADADIIVYIGCGERGNEMTDVMNEFPTLLDPKTKQPLIKRTILIANTSDMPVSAREASIYTGITIAEYFRDMGYNVALMADSTSRWAEALREMSGRLEEMPGDEGYPAYLSSRLAEFYERAGLVETLGSKARKGSVTVIGAVSPPGGDLSEPVSQATLRVVKTFWCLSSNLAYKRHFPAIDWLQSYSLYSEQLAPWYENNISSNFSVLKSFVMNLLQEEGSLQEIIRLVGADSLSSRDRLTLDTAKMIREDFLHQNAFDLEDTYTSLKKQYKMLEVIKMYYDQCSQALLDGIGISELLTLKVKQKIARAKFIEEGSLGEFEIIKRELVSQLKALYSMGDEVI